MEETGRATPANSGGGSNNNPNPGNGGSKPTTPNPAPSPPTTSSANMQPQTTSSSPSIPSSSPSTAATSHHQQPQSRYGGYGPYAGQMMPPYPSNIHHPNSGAVGGGGYPPPPSHQHGYGGQIPPPPPHHQSHHHPHHPQYSPMPPMMMPPPSQYPGGGPTNRPPVSSSGPPPGASSVTPPPQHVPSYGNYRTMRLSGPPAPPAPPPPPPGPHHPPPPPGPSAANMPPYYAMRHPPHPQMPPQQQQLLMNKNYVGYPPPPHPSSNYGPPPPPPNHPNSIPPHGHPQLHPPPHGHPQAIPPQANSPASMIPGSGSVGGHHSQHHHQHSNVYTSSETQSSTMTNSQLQSNNNNNSGHQQHHGHHQRLQPQPPPIMDEVSQTSTASSQDRADDSCASGDLQSSSSSSTPHNSNSNSNTSSSTNANNKSHNTKSQASHHASSQMLHPPTPNTSNLGSPGAASLSSFHDDFDSVSSPSWPRTPAPSSPAINSGGNSSYSVDAHISVHNSKRPDNVKRLYDMSDDPDRKPFLDKYFQFLDECGTPLNQVPTISKVPVDLYRLYMLVKERGGYVEVTNSKMWKECAQLCNIANSSSASYTLRKQYMKHLLPFECKFDRGGIDVGPFLSAAESANTNRKKSAAQSKLSNSDRSTPNTPRLSPNDSSSGPIVANSGSSAGAAPPGPYHPGHPQHQSIQSSYPPPSQSLEMNQNSYGPNAPGNASPYHHSQQGPYPPPPVPDYHQQQQPAAYGGPPPPPSSASGPNQHHPHHHSHHSNIVSNHESVSVKDPFADEDTVSSSASSATRGTPKSGGQQQQVPPPPPPGQYGPARQPHYPMPNSTGSFYGQTSGPPPNSGPPLTNSGYPPPPPPEGPSSQGHGYQAPDQPPHYLQRSGTSAPENALPPSSSGGSQSHYSSRSVAIMNGPMHPHHPHGPYYGHYGQQQQPPYPPNEPHSGNASGPHPPPPTSRSSYEQHHSQHGYPPPPPQGGHRYPMPNNVGGPSNQYQNRLPYGQQPPPSLQTHPNHSSSNVNSGIPPPNSGPPQQQYPPNSNRSQDGYPPPPPQSLPPSSSSNKTSDFYNNTIRSPLAQRLLAAKLTQNSTAVATPPPNSSQVSNNGAAVAAAVTANTTTAINTVSNVTTATTSAITATTTTTNAPIMSTANTCLSSNQNSLQLQQSFSNNMTNVTPSETTPTTTTTINTNSNSNNNNNMTHASQGFPSNSYVPQQQQQQQQPPPPSSSASLTNIPNNNENSSTTSSNSTMKPNTSSIVTAPSMQAQTNISWMSTQNARYQQQQQQQQSKRHPDFAKQAPDGSVGVYNSGAPYPTTPPSSSTSSTASSQHHTNSSITSANNSSHVHSGVNSRNNGPPPGSSPPNSANWAARDNYRMPGVQHSTGGFYPHHGYPGNSLAGPHSGQRDSVSGNWFDQRVGPQQPPPSSTAVSASTSSNSMDSPMTTAHWASSRYPHGSGPASGSGGYVSEFGPPESQPHFPSSSAHSGKMVPPAQYNIRNVPPSAQPSTQPTDQPSSRSSFSNNAYATTPGMKLPPSMMNSSSQPYGTQYPPSGSYGPSSTPSHHHHNSAQMINPQRSNELQQQQQQLISLPPTAVFPPNSVEATMPLPSKRRKLKARDIAPVDAWRVYMALKSGLLAESTYALDVLNVISNDDISLLFLGLSNMPGLLEVLLEHYRRYLNEIFDSMFEDIEIGYDIRQKNKFITNDDDGNCDNKNIKNKPNNRKLKWYELERDLIDEKNDTNKILTNNNIMNNIDQDIKKFIRHKFKFTSNELKFQLFRDNDMKNYTKITRNGKKVKIREDKNLFITDYDKCWDPISDNNNDNDCKNNENDDYFKLKQSLQEHWKKGGGETTNHIQTHMEPKENYFRFCRLIKNLNDCYIIENENDVQNNNSGNVISNDSNNENIPEENNENEYPKIHPTDRERYLKKLNQPDFEDESYDQEEPAVCTGREYQDSIKSRCLTVSNLIRNLTFLPGNDVEMCRSPCLLLILSRLILLHHVHALKKKRKINEIDCTKIIANRLDDETMFNLIDEKPDDNENEIEKEWWWESLHLIRENTMVTLANISGQLDLSTFPESITLSLLDGLLHWAICPSSYAQDAFPSAPNTLSPRRLAYESLSKLSIFESNVDLILATPPWSRIEEFLKNLTRSLVRTEDQTIREFSIVLLSNFAAADPSVVRIIALTGYSVSLLLGFIEQAEQSAMTIANLHGIQYLKDNFDSIGTTYDMIRRAATILLIIAKNSEYRSLFIQHEQRLLSLSMSQIFDNSITTIIADILFECSSEMSNNSNVGNIKENFNENK